MDKGLLDRLTEIEKSMNIVKEQEEAPKQSVIDKLTGKKRTDKEFKVPFKARVGQKQKLKKNYSLILWISSNGYTHLDFAPIEDDFAYNKHAGTWHKVTANYTLWYNKYPLLIIPEYSNIPFNAKDHAENIEDKGLSARNQKVLLETVRKADSAGKKKFGGNVLWILIAGAVVLYLIAQFAGVQL